MSLELQKIDHSSETSKSEISIFREITSHNIDIILEKITDSEHEYYIKTNDWKLVKIPKNIWEKIQSFFKNKAQIDYDNNYKFDCYCFALFLSWLEISKKSFPYNSFYQIHQVWELKSWDIIILWNIFRERKNSFMVQNWLFVENTSFHFAVYLWNWLYVSKFETDWVFISDLNLLKSRYPYKDTIYLRKN